MIRTTFSTSLLFLALVAGPAVAESTPAAPPASLPPATADAPTTSDAPVDAFGLPCEVRFTPRAVVAPVKLGKKARGRARLAPAAAPAPTLQLTTSASDSGRGGEFVLDRNERGPATPRAEAEVHMQAATVTAAMVGVVVREHADQLDLCMTKLPRDARAATVGLVLTIEADGSASAAKVTGAPRAPAFASCLAAQARTWAFPHTDAAVQLEYPIVVNGR